MGKNQRNRKLKKEEFRQFFKLQPKTWSEKIATWPTWALFLYRFSISFLILLPIALIGLWLIPNNSKNMKTETESKIKAVITTDFGEIKLDLYDQAAPKTVENFVKLSEKNYYNNLIFHRVMKDFMIQAGDPFCLAPTETQPCGAGGVSAWGEKFEDEINPNSLGLDSETIKSYEQEGYQYRSDLKSHKMEVGVIAMANAGPNTNGSQFFIVTKQDQPHLNGKHTVFGKVTLGMEIVNAIAAVEVDQNDRPLEDVKIKEIRIEK